MPPCLFPCHCHFSFAFLSFIGYNGRALRYFAGKLKPWAGAFVVVSIRPIFAPWAKVGANLTIAPRPGCWFHAGKVKVAPRPQLPAVPIIASPAAFMRAGLRR